MGQIVRFVALNHRRKGIRQQTPSVAGSTLDEMASSKSGSSMISAGLSARGELPDEQAFFDDQVMHALSAVQDVARACLLLRVIEDMDYKQISAILEIPEGTAMSYVHRARTFLRQRLAQLRPSPSGSNHAP
jgi:RNA polymerase sigma-70 factor (ECF subfamily)